MELLIYIFVAVIAFVIYFAPSLIARDREHHQGVAIFALNLFLGWTFLGWVLALVWALTATQKASATQQAPAKSLASAVPSNPIKSIPLLAGLVIILVVFVWLYIPDSQETNARKTNVRETNVREIEACTNRGITYFKSIGSYPNLKTAPNAGRSAGVVAHERCTRTTGAFDGLADDTNSQAERKKKLADDVWRAELANASPRNWSETRARASCSNELRRLYGDAFRVHSFVGKQPHENDTTLVGLTLIDERTEYKGKKVTVGCIFGLNGAFVTLFFNTKIAGWTEPPKR